MPKGPRHKPTKLKILRGNPGRRELNDREPAGAVGIPESPAGLHPRVQAQWDRAASMLLDMGVLQRCHGMPLFMLCRAAADYLTYCDIVPPGSDVLLSEGKRDKKGKVIEPRSPYWNLAASARDKAELRLYRMLLEFGLTPAAAARVKTPGTSADEDPLEMFFRGKKGA